MTKEQIEKMINYLSSLQREALDRGSCTTDTRVQNYQDGKASAYDDALMLLRAKR